MDSKRVLSLLGLALRGGNLAVGEEPVEGAARARDARVILLAGDAAAGTVRRAEHFAQAGQCILLQTPFSKEELGAALGRSSVALAAVTDTGLGNAVVHRLAEGDPDRYGQAAARMEVKARRAKERQAERLAHERNVRQGKRRAHEAPPPQGRPRKDKGMPPPGRGAPRDAGETSHRPKGAPSRAKGASRGSGGTWSRSGGGPRGSGSGAPPGQRTGPGRRTPAPGTSRPGGPGAGPYAHSRPVKKGKGSFRKREG